MHKLFLSALIVGGIVTFVGADVVGATVRRARESVRAKLTADVPLRTQLAEAQAQVDAYAENVIRGEISADDLASRIADTRREVSARTAAIERERTSLAALKTTLETERVARLVSDAPTKLSPKEREALRRARDFQLASTLVERRARDLEALEADHTAVLKEIDGARTEQARLADEVHVLRAEIDALEARESVAQTRKSCRDAAVDASGFGDARARLDAIRASIRTQNKKLEYYALKYDTTRFDGSSDGFLGGDPIEALKSVLEPAAR